MVRGRSAHARSRSCSLSSKPGGPGARQVGRRRARGRCILCLRFSAALAWLGVKKYEPAEPASYPCGPLDCGALGSTGRQYQKLGRRDVRRSKRSTSERGALYGRRRVARTGGIDRRHDEGRPHTPLSTSLFSIQGWREHRGRVALGVLRRTWFRSRRANCDRAALGRRVDAPRRGLVGDEEGPRSNVAATNRRRVARVDGRNGDAAIGNADGENRSNRRLNLYSRDERPFDQRPGFTRAN